MSSVSPEQTDPAPVAVTAHTRVDEDEGISCGELLRRAREQRGFTLQQIAQATKLPLRHLIALERDEFATLPGGLYRRAEVRAYADAVGLERSVALARLDHALKQAPSRPRASAQPPRRPSMLASLRRRLMMVAGVAVMTGGIAVAMWPSGSDAPHIPAVRPASAPTSPTIELSSDTHSQPLLGRADREVAAATVESQLTVVTEPPGARVTVNGIGWGVTPVTIRYLTPGPKSVRVTLEGYVPDERLIRLDDRGGEATVRIPLRTKGNERESFSSTMLENDGARNSFRSDAIDVDPR